MEIGEVLSRAWQVIWKHKILWIFGILSSCSSANWGPNLRSEFNQPLPPRYQYYFHQIPNWQIALLVGIAILVILLIIILAIFLGTIGRIGMIRGTVQADQGEARLSFGELFRGSLPYFWRVFLLNLLVGLAFAIIVIFFTIILAVSIIGIPCLIPFFCLLAPIAVAVGVVVEQASIAIVVENLDILNGLRRGWDVVRQNLGAIIAMAVILIVGGMIAGWIIGLPVIAILAPALIGAFSGAQRVMQGGLVLAGLCLVFYIPVAIVLYGILQGYIRSAWTLTYLRLTRPQAAAPVSVTPVE